MECNKDEAIRAKTIAERKLGDKDFPGARKFALKAQTLYPGLEGLSQMFTIVDVYISAENKVSGEVDWHGILGVSPSDDDETIKKQYRKLALTLHPDKNKSVGADGAFKLLSEAWSLLSDKSKRFAYNQRRSTRGFQSGGPSAAPGTNGFHKFTDRSTSKSKTQKNTSATQTSAPADPPPPHRTDTFWTVCHICKMHYEYLKIYLNHTLLCPNCQEPFLASEMAPPVNFPKSSHSSARQQHQGSRNHARSSNTFDPGRNSEATKNSRGPPGPNSFTNHKNNFLSQSISGSTEPSIAAKAANVVQQVNERLKRESEESYSGFPFKNRKIDDGGQSYGGRMPCQTTMGNGGCSMGNVSGLRKSCFETNRVFSCFDSKFHRTMELSAVETRNMLMHKALVEIRRKLSQWNSEKVEGRKKEKHKKVVKSNSSDLNGNVESSTTKGRQQAADKNEAETIEMNVPDPDFFDFDQDRTDSSFTDNQVWASYDDDDGMPRFYAAIHNVRKPFKMKVSWLRARTNDEFGPLPWVASGFTKTCGVFRHGRHEFNNSINSFSHKVEWVKNSRGEICIFPRKGDVWALYRNWSKDWNALTPDDVIHKYEMVEVLDDYSEENGVLVTPLIKVTGFRTVFHANSDRKKVRKIPKEEMFRFSHQVPKYLLTGEEAENAPKGCLELDPAATPLELLQETTVANEEPITENGVAKA